MKTLAERLIEAREEKGWKKAELKRRAGVKSPSTLTELEDGTLKNSPQLPAIADALGVEVLWLQQGRGPKYKTRAEAPTLDVLTVPVFPLRCPECGEVSHKSFVELEMYDRLPCGKCGITFNINNQYGNGELKMFMEALGRSGFILRQNRKFD